MASGSLAFTLRMGTWNGFTTSEVLFRLLVYLLTIIWIDPSQVNFGYLLRLSTSYDKPYSEKYSSCICKFRML